jgi:purine-binding chemotaxis protein CheW
LEQLLSFKIDGYQFGLHLQSVQKVVQAVEIQPLVDGPDAIVGVINVHGKIMPVLNTRKRLGLPERPLTLTDFFIIASAETKLIALIVDSVQGVLNYSADQLIKLEDTLSQKHSGSVLRIVDGLLLMYDSDNSLNVSEWSSLAIALDQIGSAHGSGN